MPCGRRDEKSHSGSEDFVSDSNVGTHSLLPPSTRRPDTVLGEEISDKTIFAGQTTYRLLKPTFVVLNTKVYGKISEIFMTFLSAPQVRSVSLETKQICAKALLNLVAEDTLPALIEVRRGNSGFGAGSHIV